MNESNIPPKIPAPAVPVAPETVSPSPNPEDEQPILALGAALEAMLRQPSRVLLQLRASGGGRLIAFLALISLACSAIYGVVVGSFSGGTQYWASPVKIVIGLAISALICLPSLYIFACLSGSKARLKEVAGFVAGAVALMAVLLIGFAPVAWIFSQSTDSVVMMGALHLGFWGIAVSFGLRFLSRAFVGHGHHPGGINVWMIIFVLVMLQMTTALRPILGTADTLLPTEKKFFLKHWADQLDANQ